MISSAKNAALLLAIAAKQVLTQNIHSTACVCVGYKEAYAIVRVFVCAPQVGIKLQTGLRACVAI